MRDEKVERGIDNKVGASYPSSYAASSRGVGGQVCAGNFR